MITNPGLQEDADQPQHPSKAGPGFSTLAGTNSSLRRGKRLLLNQILQAGAWEFQYQQLPWLYDSFLSFPALLSGSVMRMGDNEQRD